MNKLQNLQRNGSVKIVGLLLALVMLSGCAASAGGYISGKVLDAETNEPVSDVHVIIMWDGERYEVVQSRSVCVGVDATLTNKEGEFRFLPWVKPTNPLIGRTDNHIQVYKYGYRFVIKKEKNIYFIKLDSNHERERLLYLSEVIASISCSVSEDKKDQLLPLYKSIYNEAKGMSNSEEGLKVFRRLKHRIVSNIIGGENSLSRKETDLYFEEKLKVKFQ